MKFDEGDGIGLEDGEGSMLDLLYDLQFMKCCWGIGGRHKKRWGWGKPLERSMIDSVGPLS